MAVDVGLTIGNLLSHGVASGDQCWVLVGYVGPMRRVYTKEWQYQGLITLCLHIFGATDEISPEESEAVVCL